MANPPSENMIIRGCTYGDGHGGVVVGSALPEDAGMCLLKTATWTAPNGNVYYDLRQTHAEVNHREHLHAQREGGTVPLGVLKINLDYEHEEVCCRWVQSDCKKRIHGKRDMPKKPVLCYDYCSR